MSVKNNFINYRGESIEDILCVEEDSHGLMCPDDKVKLNTIETGAEVNVLTGIETKGLGSDTTKFLTQVTTKDNTTIMLPTAMADGSSYKISPNVLPLATTSKNGAMSSTDKAKLDAITVTGTELNYSSGLTGNIQTQLNNKSNSDHKHASLHHSNGTETFKIESSANGDTYYALPKLTNVQLGTESNPWLNLFSKKGRFDDDIKIGGATLKFDSEENAIVLAFD